VFCLLVDHPDEVVAQSEPLASGFEMRAIEAN
jgi:hypothetical protein